jgi:hypothetical protein
MAPVPSRARRSADVPRQPPHAASSLGPAEEEFDEEFDAPSPELAGDPWLDSDPFDDEEPLPERGDFWPDPDELGDDSAT